MKERKIRKKRSKEGEIYKKELMKKEASRSWIKKKKTRNTESGNEANIERSRSFQ